MSLVRLDKVVHRYREQRTGNEVEALRVHELAIEPGERLTVVGPNGSGKSTLLETLACLRRPSSGRVLFGDTDVWTQGKTLWARRQCPMLLQRTVLFSTSVLRNVSFGLRVRGMARDEAVRRAEQALEVVGMRRLAHRRRTELSGGERRRVALAQLLALGSQAIVLDEPTAGLDRESEQVIESLIRSINREHGATIIMASHNVRQAVALSTRVVTLIDGKLIPEILDNVFLGVMRRTPEGFEFRENRGWVHLFPPEELAQDRWEGVGPLDGPVQLAIPSTAIALADPADPATPRLAGAIDSLRKGETTCRMRVCLERGPTLHAEIPNADWENRTLNLGHRVGLVIAENAVCVLPGIPNPGCE